MSTRQPENLIKKLNLKASKDLDQRIHNQINNTLAENQKIKSATPPPIIWRNIMKSKMIKLSSVAAVTLFILGLLIFIGNGETLYAQVAKAFEKARSIHVVLTEYRDGNWFKDYEIWYDSEEGVREEERYENQVDIRIDNKQYEWSYTVGEAFAAEINSYRDTDELAKDLCGWLRFDPERNPSGDKVIDGMTCKMYTLSTSGADEKVSVWVNEKHRVLEFEQEEQRNGQVIRTVATINYDIDIDKKLFSPKFDTNVEIVGPTGLIEEEFPLDTAIFKRESLGFVYGVHILDFVDEFKYLVCSNRLTEQTRNEISDGDPWTYYGDFTLFGRYDEFGIYLDTSDVPILLAEMRHDGIQVRWYILIPSGDKAKQTASCDVDILVNAANQLKEKLMAKGLPINEKFRLNLTHVDTNKPSLSLSEICSEIYSLGEKLAPMVHSFALAKLEIESNGNKVISWKKPRTELTEEDYAKDIESRIEYYLNQN